MAVSVSCPSCKTRVKVSDERARSGKTVRCPECEEPLELPEQTGTTTRPGASARRAAETAAPSDDAVDRLDTVDDEDRKRGKRARDDDEEDEDRPRPRRKRDGDEDEDDDRPARRKKSRAKKKSGGLGLVIGIGAGVVVLLLLVGCGIGAYLLMSRDKAGGGGGPLGALGAVADNPAVNDANFDKIKTDMTLQAVEQLVGPGAECSNEDARAVIASTGGIGMADQISAAADNPEAHGLAGWYRWKNGPTTLLVAVDGAKTVRIAGLVTVTANGHSTRWKSHLNVQGGGGIKPPPRRPKR